MLEAPSRSTLPARPRPIRPLPFREMRRTWDALRREPTAPEGPARSRRSTAEPGSAQSRSPEPSLDASGPADSRRPEPSLDASSPADSRRPEPSPDASGLADSRRPEPSLDASGAAVPAMTTGLQRPAGALLAHEAFISITRTRALMQVVLTALLVPVCLWTLFGAADTESTSHEAASALLGAVVAFWLKD